MVAISINLERIISYAGLPERGLVTLLLLLGVLVLSLLGLEPGLSRMGFGWVVLIEGTIVAVVVSVLTLRSRPPPGEESHLGSALAIGAIGTVPFVVAGISLLAESGGGIEWVLGGFVSAIVAAMLNAWVLLVEILR